MLRDTETEGLGLSESEGDTLELGLKLIDNDSERDGLKLGLSEPDKLGESEGDTLDEGLRDSDSDTDSEGESD